MHRMILALIALFISNMALADGKKLAVKIDGMTCPSCAASVEGQLTKLDAVSRVEISLSKGAATITLKDKQNLADDVINDAVKKAGYKAVSIHPER